MLSFASAAERQKKYEEMMAASKKRTEEFNKRVEEVLTPEQIEKLKELRRTGWVPGLGGAAVPKNK